jgi:hypothetical protein
VTHIPNAENDHLPIYDDLVRERGDAVAEAQLAAEHTQHRAAELLTGQDPPQQARHQDGNAGAGQPEWRGSLP